MTTYQECGCIVVKVSGLTAWLEAHVGSNDALLTVQPRFLLGYMLLHEVGHWQADEPAEESSAAVGARPGSSRFNREPTAQKQRELKADSFAAFAIRSALGERGTKRGLAAATVSIALSQLSWNLAVHRALDEFGGTIVRQPVLLWDAGTSHPNLEWRILVVNDLIQDNDTSHRLLRDFENARSDNPKPLYERRVN
jgi:hypothetical protein